MKTLSLLAGGLLSTALLVGPALNASAQGMPADSRKNIHQLFDEHQQIERTVKLTKQGYTATTTSTNAEVAAALQAHVKQMSARLKSGLMVRRWDPAFEEYVEHYNDIEHQFTKIPNGIKATVTGRNEEAIRIAQNHAQIISDFAAHGWQAHDRSHPAVVEVSGQTTRSTPGKARCKDCQRQAASQKDESSSPCACGMRKGNGGRKAGQ